MGYDGSKSESYSEALRDHCWLERGMIVQVDSLDGRNPTFEEILAASVSEMLVVWVFGVTLRVSFCADDFLTHPSRTHAQSMLLLMCCKLRRVQELVQLPALRACLLEALRHGIVTETYEIHQSR